MTTLLTATQKATAQAIINIFETSSVQGDYGRVAVISGDTGHLSFGRSQATLGSGNLAKLVSTYCATPGARFAQWLEPYSQRLSDRDFSLDNDVKLQNLLLASADDIVMRDVQDQFFDTGYWQPAESASAALCLALPLSVAVVYDSHVQGSWDAMRDETTTAAGGLPSQLGETQWVTQYLATRRAWLAKNARDDLRATVYRMDAFSRLIALNFWDLALPIVVRSCEISSATLAQMPPHCYSGPAPGSRTLLLQTPLEVGLDARLLQLALSQKGIDIVADGIFGQGSVNATKQYQQGRGLVPTGIADPTLIVELTAPLQ